MGGAILIHVRMHNEAAMRKWTVNPAVNQNQQYGRGSTSASYEWAGLYTVLHVHNESSASGQAPEEEGPGSC